MIDPRIELLKTWLKTEGRKQRWLCAKIGLHEAALSKILHGERVPQPEFFAAVAQVTGLNLEGTAM